MLNILEYLARFFPVIKWIKNNFHSLEFTIFRRLVFLQNLGNDAPIPNIVGLFGKNFGFDSQLGNLLLWQTLTRTIAVDRRARLGTRDDQIVFRPGLFGSRGAAGIGCRFGVGVVQDNDITHGA